MEALTEDVLRTLLINPNTNKAGAEIICTCPFCKKENHFYINSITNLWSCKKCNREGNLISFLYGIGRTDLIRNLPTSFSINGGAMGKMPVLKVNKEVKKDIGETSLNPVHFPVGFKRIYEDEYLKSRRFNYQDFFFHPVGYTKLKSRFEDYVLIGVTERDKLVGYVGRYIGQDNQAQRYQNSKNTDFGKLLFNYNSITENTNTIILVEGIFDAIATENALRLKESDEIKCLATFGKKISNDQNKKLKAFRSVRNIVLLYDGRDAIDEMKKYAFVLEEEGFNVKVGFYEKKDPGAWSRNTFLKVLNSLTSPTEFFYKRIKRVKIT